MGKHCPKLPRGKSNNDNQTILLEETLSEIHRIKLNDTNKYLWHYPPSLVMQIFHQYLRGADVDISTKISATQERNDTTKSFLTKIVDPYEGTNLFVVVRNPYDRIISAYYHWETMHHPVDQCNSAGLLNRLVQESLDDVEKNYFMYRGGHYIPQYDFVYDTTATTTKKKVVDHVIHFENLKPEFEQLMKEYNLNVTLDGPVKRKRNKKATLTKNDLSAENRQRIEHFYAKDFEEFGYPIMGKS